MVNKSTLIALLLIAMSIHAAEQKQRPRIYITFEMQQKCDASNTQTTSSQEEVTTATSAPDQQEDSSIQNPYLIGAICAAVLYFTSKGY